MDGYHDHEEFVRTVEQQYLESVDAEVRPSRRLVSDEQYTSLFETYVQHVRHWVKNEKMRNRHTGDGAPGREAHGGDGGHRHAAGRRPGRVPQGFIRQIGAHRLENPEGAMDYARIFPDLFRRLRAHFFEERKRALSRGAENVLKALSDERSSLSSRELEQVNQTLAAMRERHGYCDVCAKEAILFLVGSATAAEAPGVGGGG